MTDALGVEPIHFVHDAILDAGEAVDRMAAAIDNLAGDTALADLTAVVRALINLRAVVDQAQDAQAALAEYAHHLMPSPQVAIPDIGPIERTGGWNRKEWEHGTLLSKVVQWANEDRVAHAREHDGEAPPETEGETVVRLLQRYAGIAYWKVTGPRDERGLDVDQYCRKEPKRKGIRLPKREGIKRK